MVVMVSAVLAPALGKTPAFAAPAPAPNTTITAGPATPTNSTSATFSFTSTINGSIFTCKLDTAAAAACTTPKAYSGLAAGSHTFSVYATAAGAVDTTPATSTWVVDTTAPTLPTGLTATAASSTSVTTKWTASTDNVAIAGYDLYRDGVLLVSLGNVLTSTDSAVVAGSTHTYAVRSRDTAGNTSALTTAVSVTTPFPTPDTTITASPTTPTASTSASFSFTSTVNPATFTCKLDTAAAAACTSPKALTALAGGSHTFTVYATANAVIDPTPATFTWVVDTTAPTVPTGLTATAASTTSVTTKWTASTDNVAIAGYDLYRDGVLLVSLGNVLTSTDSAVVAGSTHTYAVRSRDTSGNTSALTTAVSVTTPFPTPDTTITASPVALTNSTSASFSFASTINPATFTCKLDTAAAAACTSPKALTALAGGSHTFTVYATANALSDPTPATFTWNVDVTLPSTPTGLTATAASTTSVTTKWTASTDNVAIAGYDLYRDGVLLVGLGNVLTYTDNAVLGGTTHAYAVRSRDTAGNPSVLSAAVSVTTPLPVPNTTITSSPTTPTASASATFTFTSTVILSTFTCKLDTGAATTCTSPMTYSGLISGSHTFSVYATAAGVIDPTPATATWTVDVIPPSTPGGFAATIASATSVTLKWTASTDNVAVAGYKVYRDGVLLASPGNVLTYTDSTVLGASTHKFAVGAVDAVGNISILTTAVTVTTPPVPDTIIDTGPPIGTTATTATFSFHSTVLPATLTCQLDRALPAACTSPKVLTALAQGVHTFTVYATANGAKDATPAVSKWTVDSTAPTAPTGLAGVALSDTRVQLTWKAATDNTGVIGYDVFRDGVALANLGPVLTYTDTGLVGGSTHAYAVRARDVAANVSPLSTAVSVTTPIPFNAHLTRAPYLTDLVDLHAIVNFGTDRSSANATVVFGPVGTTGTCTLTTTVAPTRLSLSMNGTVDYQWKASLTLPAAGQYCYRVYLNGVDLLGANTTPKFTTQVPVGSTAAFTFDVFGDWGQVDANGINADQANLMKQMANSGARFAVTTGDNGYPAGSQNNYGDLATSGPDVSAVFARPFWPAVGQQLAVFPAIGNHGVTRADAVHPHFANWPQDQAVATSAGRYQNDSYASVNGSTVQSMATSYYAFNAGTARFYVLDAAWNDPNIGTASAYANEAASHWKTTSPEYIWLKADLAAHPSGLKFAFFHYPTYSDANSATEASDTSLQGAANLEGLLSQNGVNLTFSGHAHIYQRSTGLGGMTEYTTGGGGALVQSLTSPCATADKYAISWSPTTSTGSACGTARAPTSASQVYHFLKVTVTGVQVTVTPTSSTGATFDAQTYTFAPKTDTYLDSTPLAGTTSTSATFAFHADTTPATFTCSLDGAAATACTSPITYTGLAQKAHTFSATATVNKVVDPVPAAWKWSVDATAPTAPSGLTAAPTSAFGIQLKWTAGTDNLGVTNYNIYRDGALLTTIAPATTYTDGTVFLSSTHQYAVQSVDVAGNVSAKSNTVSASTPAPAAAVFSDGFESGDLSSWTVSAGLAAETTTKHGGAFAAEGNTTTGATFAKETLPSTYADGYARVWFNAIGANDTIGLLRMRDAAGNSLGYVFEESTGQLAFHDDATGVNTLSATVVNPGWHALELHLKIDSTIGATGTDEVWLDNTLVSDLSSTAVDTGTVPIGAFQIGETQTGRTYDVAFDDAAFGTSRLGPIGDTTPPSVPASVTATATSGFSVQVGWAGATDDVGVTGYDVFRDGVLLTSVGTVTSFLDSSVLAGTAHTYAVRATDLAGNASALSPVVSVVTPVASPPVFSDGFETGDLSGWTSIKGLGVESADVRSGLYAAEGKTVLGATYAKETLPSTYTDGYARLGFEIKSQTSQVNVMRMRDGAGASIGYAYVTVTGKLGFHNDATGINTNSATTVTSGWHALELHIKTGGATGTVEVWLDGSPVTALSSVGTATVTATSIGQLQAGETGTGTWDVVFDDAAFGTSRLGPYGDTTVPAAPASLTATAASAFAVQLAWSAASDNLGVAGYDVYRDGKLAASVGAVTSFTDSGVLASSTYAYAVRTVDQAGNVSALSTAVSVATPAAAPPIFADGFESGDASGWTTSSGFNIQSTDVNSGTYAAEGNTTTGATYAQETLPATYVNAYARLSFEINSQVNQVNLLRMRDASGNSVGYVYVTAGGYLGFHNDATATNSISTALVGAGWHSLELHLGLSGAASTVEVWLDGSLVTGLSNSATAMVATSIAQLQIGDTATGTWDALFDDAGFGTSRLGPNTDLTPPSVPTGITATAASGFAVTVTWGASTDNTGVTGYNVYRDGSFLASAGATTSYTDSNVVGGSTHTYAVLAVDQVGNVSALSPAVSVTTPIAAPPLFADGFESGDVSGWTSSAGLSVENTDVRSGAYAAEGSTTTGATYAKETLPSTYTDGYARVGFELKSQTGQANLLRVRDASGTSIGYLYVTAGGRLGFHNDGTSTNTVSTTSVAAGWHSIELHVGLHGTASAIEVWLDGSLVGDLSDATTATTTATSIGQMQIGDTGTGTWDVVFDDAAFGTSRLGTNGDVTPPTVPSGVLATPTSPFAVTLTWGAATDNVGVSGYSVFRDGALLASVGAVTSYVDTTVLAGTTHAYTVWSTDLAGNVSAPSTAVTVTTPGAPAPIFSDGFESGDLTGWTSSAGLLVENTDVRSGTYSAEGNATAGAAYAKETLPSTYADGYARVGFEINSHIGQVNLLRVRDGLGNSIGYVYVTAGGYLGFHNDATNTNTTSTTTVSAGWHSLELHMGLFGVASTVEVWLDGSLVAGLSSVATVNTTATAIGQMQEGDTGSGTWDVVFDDAAFGTSRLGPDGDTTPPTPPAAVTASAVSAFAIQVSWTPATDDVGVTGYTVFRDGSLLASVGAVTAFIDTTVLAGTTHAYSVWATDAAGNVSTLSQSASATSLSGTTVPVFSDGFESGDLSGWTNGAGLLVENTDVRSGAYAAEGNTTAGATYAQETLPSTYVDGYARVGFEINNQAGQVNLLRMRDAAGSSIGYLYVTAGGFLGFHNDGTNTNVTTGTSVSTGWHALELHIGLNGAASTVEAWLDGSLVSGLSSVGSVTTTAASIGQMQIGETATGTWDVLFDDAAFATSRLGPTGDTTAPTAVSGLSATVTNPFAVALSWGQATDDVGVAGYSIFRDGALLTKVGAVTSYTDTTVLDASTHTYAVWAVDQAGNVSPLSSGVSVTTPSAAAPAFADGFESGDVTGWTSSAGLSVENTDVRSGTYAAEGNTTTGGAYAQQTLASTYADGFARLGFKIKSQTGQVNVMRMRDTAGNSIGYLYVTAGGFLGFHNDGANTNVTTTTAVAAGWHALELHIGLSGTASTVEVWLDGAAVSGLTSVGTATTTAASIGQLQIGETATGTWDVLFDDAAFGTSRLGLNGDATAPSAPSGLIATATSPFAVALAWGAATDNVGVTGYSVFRDGGLLAKVGAVTSFTDTTVLAGSTHTYAVWAVDQAGNVSGLSGTAAATTPAAPAPIFSDGFESGDVTGWTSSAGLSVENTDVRSGTYAAEGNTAAGSTYARETLPSTYQNGYSRVAFKIKSQTGQVNLMRMRDAAGNSIGYLYVTAGGYLGFHNDGTNINTSSPVIVSSGWHALELHIGLSGTASTVEAWLDGTLVPVVSSVGATTTTATAIGQLQIGETATGTWDVLFDDAAFGTSRLGPNGDTTAPSNPATMTATATTPFAVALAWGAATDNIGVTGYVVFRDGVVLASVGATTSYVDTTVLASSTHTYAVRAVDQAGNVSSLTSTAPVSTQAAAAPLFADGFESGTTSAWTSSTGLSIESTDVRSGTYAAEGNTTSGATWAKQTLASTYTDGYARLGFKIKSQTGQVNVMRMRDTAGNSIGYLYVTAGGFLGFHNDGANTNVTTTTAVAAGWHALELHIGLSGTASTVEVWLDGAAVSGLTSVGTATTTAASIGQLQIGETATGTWDVLFDDAAFGTSRLGLNGDATAPSAPSGLIATATSPFAVALAWGAATDNVGVTGYSVFRDGGLLAKVGAVTSFTDTTVLAGSTHTYAVWAVDQAGNVSSLSAPASATTPTASVPIVSDGFESGDVTGWTSSAGLSVENTDVRSGTYAAEGNTTTGATWAKQTLASTYTDGFARLGFKIKSQTGQVNVMRVRDGSGNSIGYLYVTAGGFLGFHNDGANTNVTTTTAVAAGWHALELHIGLSGTASTVEVWLDGAAVSGLTSVGTATTTAASIGQLQIGETATGTWDVLFDDAAFGTSRLGLNGDATAPSAPSGLIATATSPFAVALAWGAATDNVGVTGYSVFRDGGLLAKVGAVTSFMDTTVLAGSTHTYAVWAVDQAGNVSPLSAPASATTVSVVTPLFADGFETGTTSAWTSSTGLSVENTDVRSGTYAAEGNTAVGATYGKATLPSTYADGYARLGFKIKSQTGQVNLMRMRDAAGNSIGYLYVTAGGFLGFHNDAVNTNVTSTTAVATGWHALELHVKTGGATGTVEVWLDGAAVSALTSLGTATTTVASIGQLQVGETATGTWDVLFDDAAFATSRLGPNGDTTAPSAPSGLTATATSPFAVALAWGGATDNVGVAGYTVFRDGVLLASVGAITSYTDTTVLAGSTHTYGVWAVDLAGNVSSLTSTTPVSTPAAPAPLVSDGFETGTTSAWTSSAGLSIESTDVRSGTYAAEGNTTTGATWAQETLASTYTDGYARLGFKIKSQTGQVNVMRMRDGSGNSIGYLYVTAGGFLGFHNDAANTNTVSTTAVATGWHALELHIALSGTASTVEVWLDGAAVSALTSVGTATTTAASIGQLQIGETATGVWDVLFDDAAFGTSRLGPNGDTTAPSAPSGLTATTTSPFAVALAWAGSTDNIGVTGYAVFRDGVLLASVGAITSYTDTTVLAGSTHTYGVWAVDLAGNVSPISTPASATTASAATPIVSDGFETGTTSAWTSSAGLAVESVDVRSGTYAAEGNTTVGATWAKQTLPSTYTDGYARLGFKIKSQTGQVNVMRVRDGLGNSIGFLYVTASGFLGFHNDAANTNVTSTTAVAAGWHALELHIALSGTASTVEVWLDGAAVSALTSVGTATTTAASIGQLQIGETATGTWDVLFDDAAFATSRLGPNGDTTAPSKPATMTATATSPFAVALAWPASTDNIGVTGYTVFRDGVVLAKLGVVTAYTDTTVLAGSSHTYAVWAVDQAGNVSLLSSTVSATTASAVSPVFSDGFETGDVTAWTSSAGLAVESVDVRSGTYAAEGNTTVGATWAKQTLPSTYTDGYARLGFKIKSQTGQVNVMRVRDAAGISIGYLYVTASGFLGFHNDAANTNTVSTTAVATGWHALELHIALSGAASTVEVWLDGAAVSALTSVGTATTTATSIGQLQIGETGSGTWDVLFDDAAFATSRLGPNGDTTAPSKPATMTATATSPFAVSLGWTASTDNVGVVGYTVFRDGVVLAKLGAVTSFTDTNVLAGTTHTYAVWATDLAGNVSTLTSASPLTTPVPPAPLYSDGFEAGSTGSWTSSAGLAVESVDVRSGTYAAEGNTTVGATWAKQTLASTYTDGYARLGFKIKSQTGQVNLMRVRDGLGNSIGYLYVTAGGFLGFHNDAANTNVTSTTAVAAGWHALELHIALSGTASTVEVWLDGAAVSALTSVGTATTTAASIGQLQIGETATGTWDVLFDDAAFATSRLGPNGDTTAPSKPATMTATATSPFAVALAWPASTDNIGVVGYTVFRDGVVLAKLGVVTAYTDATVLAGSTHTYAVWAVDQAGNVSTLTSAAPVTTPAAAAPLFSNGFEAGSLNGWTTTAGLAVQSTDVRSGKYAAEGNTTTGATYAKQTLASTYTDGYARVGFKIKSQASQVNLMRVRDASGTSIGYLYVTAGGFLGFHNDGANTNTTSTTAVAAGWHTLELHIALSGTTSTVEVWLDGAAVSALTSIGTATTTAASIGQLQIGETGSGTWDVLFDDAAFGTSRIGI